MNYLDENLTLADYNRRAGLQPYAVLAIVSPSGNVNCADCCDHVLVNQLHPDISLVFADSEFSGVCDGCSTQIGGDYVDY